VDQRRRALVEELGVVHDQQQLAVRPGPFQDRVAGPAQQPQQVTG